MADYRGDERLQETRLAALGQRIPEPLHERVNQLCQLVYDGGHERPTKVKMIAALLLAAEPDARKLAEALAAYDRAYVRDVLLGEHKEAEIISLPTRRPGPHPAGGRRA